MNRECDQGQPQSRPFFPVLQVNRARVDSIHFQLIRGRLSGLVLSKISFILVSFILVSHKFFIQCGRKSVRSRLGVCCHVFFEQIYTLPCICLKKLNLRSHCISTTLHFCLYHKMFVIENCSPLIFFIFFFFVNDSLSVSINTCLFLIL